jgi:hypothetical protein
MRPKGNLQGWETLKQFQSQVVPQRRKPNGACKYCGHPLYWIKIITKKGPRWVPFEDGGHGGDGMKVLYNHNNMAQAERRCRYKK